MRIRNCKIPLILLFSLIQISTVALAQSNQPEKLQFSRLTTVNGLSQSTINAIVKDKVGFMWFGTPDGLNKFDGYKFKIYRNIPKDKTSLPYNLIKTLFVDGEGNLWVGTLGGGLARYNKETDTFSRYDIGLIQQIFEDKSGRLWVGTFEGLFFVDKKNGKAIPADQYNRKYKILKNKIITSILEDKELNLWIGTTNGLYQIAHNSDKANLFFIAKTNDKSEQATDGEINALTMDQKGNIWVGTRKGLYRRKNKQFEPTLLKLDEKDKALSLVINTLFFDTEDILWIGTENGLVSYNPKSSVCQLSVNDTYDPQSLSRNSINSIYSDKQTLWIGTALGGVNKHDKNNSFVSYHKIYDRNNHKANTNVITSFAESSDGQIWIGTDGGGLFQWNPILNTFNPFTDPDMKGSVIGESVLCLLKSRDEQNLWIGTYNQGLFQLNFKTKKLKRYYTGNNKLKNNSIYSILEDKDSNVWVGTNGGGISVINNQNVKVHHMTSDQPNSLTNNYIRALMEDKRGRIWIGTYGGLNIFDTKSSRFVTPDAKVSDLQKHLISSLFLDSNNKVWAGTQGAGLFIYDQNQKQLTTLTEIEGLTNNNISGIISDRKGFVWISTSRGMNRLSSDSYQFDSFLSENGLQSNEFTGGASYKLANGSLLFGSVEGFSTFNPFRYKKNTKIPPIVITDFSLHSNTILKGKDNPKFNISNSHPISIDYDQSVFTIEFAALNYTSTEKNKYAYKLEGFEKDWQYSGSDRKVTYNNLPPGKYLFRVKGSNNDDIWNQKGTSLKILIHPPIWRTTWAYILYFILTVLILHKIIREWNARERLKNKLLIQTLTAEKIEELNQLKMNFFTNISHELRTPLSLIIDPLRTISHDDVTPSQSKSLSGLAFRHALRLLTLVNQLLDFRKFEGQLKLELAQVNIKDILEGILLSFTDRANTRGLKLSIIYHLAFHELIIDPDKFQKIIENLVANAFKFTPENGTITLRASTYYDQDSQRQLEISVKDTGPGVPELYKMKIFDMFFQVAETTRYEMESSGIGLALIKELVQLHNGEISEIGDEGEGALFRLKIPVPSTVLSTINQTEAKVRSDFNLIEDKKFTGENKNEQYQPETTILIVEDNEELRKYIASHLSDYYKVEEASTGEGGYQKAIAIIPDLILSDVMMRDGDGLQLCKKVKNNEKTSHIPVILLTAKQADESRIAGYKSGADAYISKPFNSNLLRTRIFNLLESRKILRVKFQLDNVQQQKGHQMLSPIDQEFIDKAAQVIIANFLEPSFDVEGFAVKLHMNRRQLSRKLKALIDQTPQEYIIQIRLKTAIEFILHQDMNISQAAYEVGFSEPANFSRSFSKVYGQSPKNYLKNYLNSKGLD